MLRALAGIAIVAMLALPVVAQVRHHRAHLSTAPHVESNAVTAADEAAMNAAMAEATNAAAAAANEAAAAVGDDNVATDATAYDANADMSMDTNMTMDNDMSMDTNMTMDTPAPRHRRRAQPRHH
jgi:hypothetical protein